MAQAGRRGRTRKPILVRKAQNRFSMALVAFVVLVITVAVAIQSSQLKAKIAEVQERERQTQVQIDAELKRRDEIEALRTLVETKGYIIEIATERFGLVQGNEYIFQEEN